jgi:hypothetical protein
LGLCSTEKKSQEQGKVLFIRLAVTYEMDEGRNLISKTNLDTEIILAPVVMANVQSRNN